MSGACATCAFPFRTCPKCHLLLTSCSNCNSRVECQGCSKTLTACKKCFELFASTRALSIHLSRVGSAPSHVPADEPIANRRPRREFSPPPPGIAAQVQGPVTGEEPAMDGGPAIGDFHLPQTPASPEYKPDETMEINSPCAPPMSVEEAYAKLTADIEHLLVTNLPGNTLQKLLNMFRSAPYYKYSPTATTARAMREAVVEQVTLPGWEKVDVTATLDDGQHQTHKKEPMYLLMREGISDVVQQLIQRHPIAKEFMSPSDQEGNRIITEFYTADICERVCEAINIADLNNGGAGDVNVIFLKLWSDVTCLGGNDRLPVRVVSMTLANHPLEFSKTSQGQVVLALMNEPVEIEGEDDFQGRSRILLQTSTGLVFQKLKEVFKLGNYHEFILSSGAKLPKCQIFPAMYKADLKEAWELLNLTGMRDVRGLVPRGQYHMVDELKEFPLRTEEYMRAQHQRIDELRSSQVRGAKKAARELQTKVGISLAGWIPSIYDLAWGILDVHELFYNDKQHQCENGLCEHIYDALSQYCHDKYTDGLARWSVFNSRLKSPLLKSIFGVDTPSNGWQTRQLHSKEKQVLMYLTPIAAGDLFGSEAAGLLWDYVLYMHLRDRPAHTEETLARLDELISRVMKQLVTVFTKEHKDFANIVKYLNMFRYPSDIQKVGVTSGTTTADHERENKLLQEAYQHSNMKPDQVLFQVTKTLDLMSVQATQYEAPNLRQGATTRALKAHYAVSSSYKVLSRQDIQELRGEVPELELFGPALKQYLGDATVQDKLWVRPYASVRVADDEAHVVRSLNCIAQTSHNYERYNKVLVTDENAASQGFPHGYIAKVIFIFTCRGFDGAQLDLAFVHYYDMPGGNAHRARHKKVVNRLQEDAEEERSRTRCQVVVPAYKYSRSGKEPFCGIIPITDFKRLVALAPRFEGRDMSCTSWYVYDMVMPDRYAEHRFRLADKLLKAKLV